MHTNRLIILLIGLTLGAVACKKERGGAVKAGAEIGDLMAAMTSAANRACSCQDKDCAMKAMTDFELANMRSVDANPTADQKAQIQQVNDKETACVGKYVR